ncbi:MAG: hypothetical protein NDF56_08215 [archaeon GB-1845-036]|nr:hypothetical protein [Candidatus Culexmicrobium thermophilum]
MVKLQHGLGVNMEYTLIPENGYYDISVLVKWRGYVRQWASGYGFFDCHIVVYSVLQVIDTSSNTIVDKKTVYLLDSKSSLDRRFDVDQTLTISNIYLQNTKTYRIEIVNRVETYVHLGGAGGSESTGNLWSADEPSWVQTAYIKIVKNT